MFATRPKNQTNKTTDAIAGSKTARPVKKLARHCARRVFFTPTI